MEHNESITVSCNITNTGSIAGSETVFLFISDKESALPRPVKELKGFEKVSLNPGETKQVQFTIYPDQLKYFNGFLRKWIYEPGAFEVVVSSSSDLSAGQVLKAGFEYK